MTRRDIDTLRKAAKIIHSAFEDEEVYDDFLDQERGRLPDTIRHGLHEVIAYFVMDHSLYLYRNQTKLETL
jgi:hypothetical protein